MDKTLVTPKWRIHVETRGWLKLTRSHPMPTRLYIRTSTIQVIAESTDGVGSSIFVSEHDAATPYLVDEKTWDVLSMVVLAETKE